MPSFSSLIRSLKASLTPSEAPLVKNILLQLALTAGPSLFSI
jgi:hypothetical protein